VAVHIPIKAGPHSVRLLAHNIAYDRADDSWSATRHATVTRRTVAVIWSIRSGTTPSGHATLRLTGYAYDAVRRGAAPTVRILLDGKRYHTLRTNLPSPKRNKALHLTGRHRFDVTIRVPAGKHTVQVRAVPVSTYSVAGVSKKWTAGFVKR
jgi:hypothetical protein